MPGSQLFFLKSIQATFTKDGLDLRSLITKHDNGAMGGYTVESVKGSGKWNGFDRLEYMC
jgi:hypothetical protein